MKASQEVLLARPALPIPVETVAISQLEQTQHIKLRDETSNQPFGTALEIVPKQANDNTARTQSLVIPDIQHTSSHTDLIRQLLIKNLTEQQQQQQHTAQQLHLLHYKINQQQQHQQQQTANQPNIPIGWNHRHMAIKPIKATTGPNTRGMDCLFSSGMELSPHILVTTCGDMSPVSDLLDASIYASSPNSLYLYDQEKIDMQCSLGSSAVCSVGDTTSLSDDFELSSNYEVSQDISSLQMKEIPNKSHTITSSSVCSNKDEQKDIYIKTESMVDESNPTLAELNLNFDLLEDIDSYINVEMGSKVPDCQLPISTEMEQDIKQKQGVCEFSVTSSSERNTDVRTIPCSMLQCMCMPKMHIKQEPDDNVEENYQKSFAQLLKRSQPIGQGLGLGTSTMQPLSTIREIDISDCHTLQKFLTTISNREPLQATAPRKRPVSESFDNPSFKPSVPKRHASVAGLSSMDQKWEEIKQFLHTDEPPDTEESSSCARQQLIKKERTRYDSTSSVMTLTSNEDEESDSDKDFDDDSDSDLEGGADIKLLSATESLIGSKDKQHFWQYNVQSKGPKGTRVHFDMEEDPHVLNDFEDPVFDLVNSDNLSGIGVTIKHGGKARKGDGNDIVPSPKKLCQIGLQLQKISKQINDFIPVSELPSAARSKTRKEKNKLASRACRLKKKAQHEANKVKLHGLEIEHRKLLIVICQMRRSLLDRLNNKSAIGPDQPSMTDMLQALIKEHLGTMIAGNTVEYVNSIIHKVEAGDLMGGLLITATRSYPKELHK